MAIKLADVIENVNSDYPVLDASISATTGGGIKGFGIFRNIAGRNAVPADKRCYGYVAVVLFADGGNNEVTSVDSTYDYTTVGNLPQYDANNTGTVSVTDQNLFLGISNSVISSAEDIYKFGTSTRVYVYKTQPHGIIATSNGSAADFFGEGANVSASLQDVTDEIAPGDWTDADNWVEISLAGNSYPKVSSESIVADAEDYVLTLYDRGDKDLKGLEVDELMAWITSTLMQAIIDAGYGSTSLYTNPDTGVFGDYNGDGNVGAADLLIFLGAFGGALGGATVPTLDDTSVNNTTCSLTDPTNALEVTQDFLGNDTWSSIPEVSEFIASGSDYQTPMFFTAGNTTAVAGAFNVSLTIGSSATNRSTITFSEDTGENDATWGEAVPKLRLTAFALVGWARTSNTVNSSVGFVWRMIYKNSSNAILYTQYRRIEKVISSSLAVGSTADAIDLMDGIIDPIENEDSSTAILLADFGNSSTSSTVPGIPANIPVANIATVTIELDYYVPNADSAIYYAVAPSFTLILDEG